MKKYNVLYGGKVIDYTEADSEEEAIEHIRQSDEFSAEELDE